MFYEDTILIWCFFFKLVKIHTLANAGLYDNWIGLTTSSTAMFDSDLHFFLFLINCKKCYFLQWCLLTLYTYMPSVCQFFTIYFIKPKLYTSMMFWCHFCHILKNFCLNNADFIRTFWHCVEIHVDVWRIICKIRYLKNKNKMNFECSTVYLLQFSRLNI